MYNIKVAVSRLEFAPGTNAMEITDISTGHFVFSPVAGKKVSFSALNEAIQGAGYEIEMAQIEVTGQVSVKDDILLLETSSGQRFQLRKNSESSVPERGAETTLRGIWSEQDGQQIIEIGPDQAGRR